MPNDKKYDHPEQYKTDEESLFDKFESQKNVDPLPVEDLNEEVKEEKEGEESKDTSSTQKKYEADFKTIKKKKFFGDE